MPIPGKLRLIRDDELGLMLSWRNHSSIRSKMFTRHEIAFEEHLRWWEKIHNSTDQHYFMYENAGRALGIIAFNGIDTVNAHAFWAFYAAPDAPRGTGSYMWFHALEHAFGLLALHKVSGEVLDINETVINMHLKFGFSPEGIFRAQHKYDGSFIAIHRFGILAEEWQQQRQIMLTKLGGKE
jgi:UDP-4-amino-4,6-dideoxy-N-acetyl-beta-L-altrosamine N-acetyltransferase